MGGDEGAPSNGEGVALYWTAVAWDGRSTIVGDGESTTKGSWSTSGDGVRDVAGCDGACSSGVSATLSVLAGRANGLFGRSEASCDGLRTNGDSLVGDSRGDEGLLEDCKVLIGDRLGVVARTVDGDLVTGDSGRLKGDGRGEPSDMASAVAVNVSLERQESFHKGASDVRRA